MAEVKSEVKSNPVAAKPKISELQVRSRFVRTTPDKIRFVSKLVIKKELESAINHLQFSNLEARKPLLLLLKNARSQAKDKDIVENLYVKSVVVDEGPKLKRRRIVQQGRATTILKRHAHIKVNLTTVNPKVKKSGEK